MNCEITGHVEDVDADCGGVDGKVVVYHYGHVSAHVDLRVRRCHPLRLRQVRRKSGQVRISKRIEIILLRKEKKIL